MNDLSSIDAPSARARLRTALLVVLSVRKDGYVSVDGESGRAIRAAVQGLPNDLDPYGLEPGGSDGVPVDEYSPEAAPIASHLINDRHISAADVNAVWVRWFGETLSAMDEHRFVRFVADLNALVGSVRSRTDFRAVHKSCQ